MIDPEPLPPLSGASLVRLWNAQLPREDLDPVMRRALITLQPAERAAERDQFLRRAAAIGPAISPYLLAKSLRARMVTLRTAFPGYLDDGTVDGCLAAALLIFSMKVPSAKTIQRAIQH